MKAFVTGCDGQDGSFLMEFLLEKGYEVYGLVRRNVNPIVNIDHLLGDITLCYGDMATENHLCVLMDKIKPDEVYNLAGQSDVAASFDIPEYTGEVTGLGVTRLLEAVRQFSPKSKVYQASSSEMFGNEPAPQRESTCFRARSPYAAAKIYAHNMTVVYRESYGLFACCGILFNHESERRGERFVTRKISKAVARIKLKKQKSLELGNIEAKRDWGYAPDYVRAMWMMLQQDEPDDYVIGTRETHTVKEFVEQAFSYVGLGWERYVTWDSEKYTRPSDVNVLCADTLKANSKLGWYPEVGFKELVQRMVEADMEVESEND